MQSKEFKGLTVTLSDGDTNKLKESWQKQHWRCIVYNKTKRTQMGFDVYGDGSRESVMTPLKALYVQLCNAIWIIDDDVNDPEMHFTKKESKAAEKSYYQCRKFIGSEDEIKGLFHYLDNHPNEW